MAGLLFSRSSTSLKVHTLSQNRHVELQEKTPIKFLGGDLAFLASNDILFQHMLKCNVGVVVIHLKLKENEDDV